MKKNLIALMLAFTCGSTFASEEYGYRLVVCNSQNIKIDLIIQSEALAGIIRITENLYDAKGELEDQQSRNFLSNGIGSDSRLNVSQESGPLSKDSQVVSLVFKTSDFFNEKKFEASISKGRLIEVLGADEKAEAGTCEVNVAPLSID